MDDDQRCDGARGTKNLVVHRVKDVSKPSSVRQK
jgi:hypothetical protein